MSRARLHVYRSRPRARFQLLCCPHGGGALQAYHPWSEILDDVELIGLDLPGRGARLMEPPYRSVLEVVEDLLEPYRAVVSRPCVLFGHSVGALIAFELARRLQARGLPGPVALVVSAHRAPHLPAEPRTAHRLSDDEILQQLRRLGGTPAELLVHPELLALVLPALRADFEMHERYRHVAGPPLEIPLVAFGGQDDDEVGLAGLRAWSRHGAAGFLCRVFPGDHFYVESQRHPLLRELRALLSQLDANAERPT
jgi:surfactin synthase thioesterase subunit